MHCITIKICVVAIFLATAACGTSQGPVAPTPVPSAAIDVRPPFNGVITRTSITTDLDLCSYMRNQVGTSSLVVMSAEFERGPARIAFEYEHNHGEPPDVFVGTIDEHTVTASLVAADSTFACNSPPIPRTSGALTAVIGSNRIVGTYTLEYGDGRVKFEYRFDAQL